MARDLSRSLAVLIGNGTFADQAALPNLPAADCVAAMSGLLAGELCGWPADRILALQDFASFPDVARRLVPALRDVHGVLLVYYVGHGVRTRKGQLALALGETDASPAALPHTAMLYESLADLMGDCPAATKLVILDCCHAELANKANFQAADLAETYPVDGLYFIGASKTHEKAKFDPLGGLTYFTGAFVDTVRSGIPGLPAELRLDQVFVELRSRLVSDGLPEPVDAGIRGARQYPFASNAVHLAPAAVQAPHGHAHGARLELLARAEQEADSLDTAGRADGPMIRVMALLRVADALDAADADRARRLAARAVRLASSSPDVPRAHVAIAVARIDPDRAYRLAGTLDPPQRDETLAAICRRLAGDRPEHAHRFAQAISAPGPLRDSAINNLVISAAQLDPELAEQIAETIPVADRLPALAEIAKVVVKTNLTRARALCDAVIAQEAAGTWLHLAESRLPVLAEIAKVAVKTDLAQAKALCDAIIAQEQTGTWLQYVVSEMAPVDPQAAEGYAMLIQEQHRRDYAYGDVAHGYAVLGRADAERVIALVTDPHWRGFAANRVIFDLVARDEVKCAERIARGIQSAQWRCKALVTVAWHSARPGGDMRRVLAAAETAACSCPAPERDDCLKEIVEVAVSGSGVPPGGGITDVFSDDLDYAVRLAGSIRDPEARAQRLGRVARAVGYRDVYRAEQIAGGITDSFWQADALVELMPHWRKAQDWPAGRRVLESAERSARRIADLARRAEILAGIAAAAALFDPPWARRLLDQADTVASSIQDDSLLGGAVDRALKSIVVHVAGDGHQEARRVLANQVERVARAIPRPHEQAEALSYLARAVFPDDPERAERTALGITDGQERIKALIMIADMHEGAT